MRLANRQRLLEALQDGGEISQAELARMTGLSAATVSGLVRTLSSEGELVVTKGVSNGRRSRMVKRSPRRRRYGIGIDAGRTHVRVVVGTDAGDVLAERATELPAWHNPQAALDTIGPLVDAVRADTGIEQHHISGIAMGIPAPVDTSTGAVTEAAIHPAWVDVPLQDELHRTFGRPVVVENDANLGAIALGSHPERQGAVVFVKVAQGIGAGVAVDGQLLRGHSGAAGEIGHLTLDPRLAIVCRCGRRGCVETVSSAESIRSALGTALERDLVLQDVLDLLSADNPVALHILEEAGETLGRALGWLAMILNPAEIALGGPLTAAGDAWLQPVRRGFRRAVLPGVASTTHLMLSPLGERTVAVGALLAGLIGARSPD
nr:ROK family transcriptional regulator [Phytoactinopolyspora mesophila]